VVALMARRGRCQPSYARERRKGTAAVLKRFGPKPWSGVP
jgi:hypothetical protein